jgi:NDP-sugar pyrophosphorylase family protein
LFAIIDGSLLMLGQIIIFCCAHADQIKAYLGDSKWLKQRSPRITTVTSTNCFSLGEAMRSLDQKDFIKSTFVLVSGDGSGGSSTTWSRASLGAAAA